MTPPSLRSAILMTLAVALAGCGEQKAPPAQQAAKALAAAREDIDKAKASIDASEKQSKDLEQRIQARRTAPRAAAPAALPAPRETELRPQLAELAKQLADVTAKLQAYRDAPPDKSAETLSTLEKSLAAFAEKQRELEAKLQAV